MKVNFVTDRDFAPYNLNMGSWVPVDCGLLCKLSKTKIAIGCHGIMRTIED